MGLIGDLDGDDTGTIDPQLVRSWTVISKSTQYDDGDYASTAGGPKMIIAADGTWEYGTRSGAWSVFDIVSSDWTRWDYGPYISTRKIVLIESTGQMIDGPIDDNFSGVSGFSIFERVTDPKPGIQQTQFSTPKA